MRKVCCGQFIFEIEQSAAWELFDSSSMAAIRRGSGSMRRAPGRF
jgi:hypothetical protein